MVPGKPGESYLIEQITPQDGVAAMPQKGEPLSPAEIELITRWIAEGAADDTPTSARPPLRRGASAPVHAAAGDYVARYFAGRFAACGRRISRSVAASSEREAQ